MTLIFEDTFTDPNDTVIDTGAVPQGHAPNLGATSTYRGNFGDIALASVASVQGNRGRFAIGPFPGIFSDFHTVALVDVTAGLSAAKEVRADIFPVASVEHSIVEILFQYRNGFLASPAAEFYGIQLRRTATPGQWSVYAVYGPYQNSVVPPPYVLSAPLFSPLLGTVTAADGGAGVRLGATRYGTTRLYDFWWEPAGGGTRTFLGSFTFPQYADSSHKEVGIGITGPGASATTVEVDNLEVEDSGSGSTPPPPTFPGSLVTRLLRYTSLASAGRLSVGNYGLSNSAGPGGGGSAVAVSGYQSAMGYSCRKVTVTGNGNPFGANGYQNTDFGVARIQAAHMFAPHPVCNRIYRFMDVVMARVTQANASPQPTSRVFWGLFKIFAADFKTMDDGWIGFYAQFTGLSAGNWFAKVGNDAETVLFSQDTGIQADSPHQLRIDLNGPAGTIDFYIDGVKVASYTVQSGQLGGTSATAPNFGSGINAGFAGGTATIFEAYHSAMSGYGGLILDETPA